MNILFIFFASSLWGIPAERIGCPASISTDTKLSVDIEGWDVSRIPGPSELAGARVFLSPIQNRQPIEPYEKKENKRMTFWYFGEPPAEDVWLECFYMNTAIRISRNIGKVIDCKAEKIFSPIPSFSIECEKPTKFP